MSKRIAMAVLLCIGGIAACGGGEGGGSSGVSESKTLISLSDAEVTTLCAFTTEADGPERTVNCPDDVIITVGQQTAAECAATLTALRGRTSCTATVGNAEDCANDLADLTDQQLCSDTGLPAACAFLFSMECNGL
jgi:hypothetical protein